MSDTIESIVARNTVPEWAHQMWRKEIHEKWEIKSAGDHVAGILREMAQVGVWGKSSLLLARAQVALERWEKLLNESKTPVV